MNKFQNSIGIDVSKDSLDAHDHCNGKCFKVPNSQVGFKQLVAWMKAHNEDEHSVLWTFEHTGMYSLPLAVYLSQKNISYVIVPGLEIKRSVGITRGKSDQIDAAVIARYSYLRRDEIKIYHLPSKNLLQLKSLLSLRERMITQRGGYQASKNEMKRFLKGVSQTTTLVEVQQQLIRELTRQIKKVEAEMLKVIHSDEILKRTYDLVVSVKGVGLVIGVSMLVYTNCFTSFDDWRKFACYCGLVPFEYQSGTSIKGRKKVNHLANKRLKGLFANAAATSLQFDPEIKLYYERRLRDGKNLMTAQNAIRNKIVSRIFAVVKRGTPYVELSKYAG